MGTPAIRTKDRGAGALHNRVRSTRGDRAGVPKADAKNAAPNDRTGAQARKADIDLSKTIPFGELAREWVKDASFVAEYERIGPAMELAFVLADARREAGLTQTDLAQRMKTSQAAIARLEGGRVKPTWETIERYARALGRRAVVTLEIR